MAIVICSHVAFFFVSFAAPGTHTHTHVRAHTYTHKLVVAAKKQRCC